MIRTLMILCSCLLLLAGRAGAAEPELLVAGNNAPPYRIFEAGKASGIYVDVMRLLAERMGVALRFQEVPFKRALKMMEAGRADVMLGPNRNAEREAYMAYTDATFQREDKVFYVKPGTPPIREFADLAGRRILVVRGATYFDRFDRDSALRRIPVANYENAARRVAKCADCAVIMPEMQGDFLLKRIAIALDKSRFRAEGKVSFITVSRASDAMQHIPALEAAMAAIKADGSYQQVLRRYGRR